MYIHVCVFLSYGVGVLGYCLELLFVFVCCVFLCMLFLRYLCIFTCVCVCVCVCLLSCGVGVFGYCFELFFVFVCCVFLRMLFLCCYPCIYMCACFVLRCECLRVLC